METIDVIKALWNDINDYYTDTQILVYISLAELRVDQNGFCGNAQLATAYMACHMASLALRDTGEAGSISSKKEGDLSVSFSNNSDKINNSLAQTSFGKEYKMLQDSCYGAFSIGLT